MRTSQQSSATRTRILRKAKKRSGCQCEFYTTEGTYYRGEIKSVKVGAHAMTIDLNWAARAQQSQPPKIDGWWIDVDLWEITVALNTITACNDIVDGRIEVTIQGGSVSKVTILPEGSTRINDETRVSLLSAASNQPA